MLGRWLGSIRDTEVAEALASIWESIRGFLFLVKTVLVEEGLEELSHIEGQKWQW